MTNTLSESSSVATSVRTQVPHRGQFSPAADKWREFAELWPDAVVVLSVRNPDDWYESVRATIHTWTTPGRDVGSPTIEALLSRLWEQDFGGWERVLDRQHAIAMFLEHNDSVRRECPAERLVEWSVKDGWKPICLALGIQVPADPFPHLNARASERL